MAPSYEIIGNLNTREEWLEARRQGVGASDMYSLLGLASWPGASAVHVWLDKLGRAKPKADHEAEILPRLGQVVEPFTAQLYVERTGFELIKPGNSLFRSRERPWQVCTPDRILVGGQPVELKFSPYGIGWGPDGSDEIPAAYLVQTQWQIDVLGVEWAHVGVITGTSFRIYTVKRDQQLIESLRAAGEEFWTRNVLGEVQPEVGPRDGGYLQKLYTDYEAGKRIAADEALEELAERYFAEKAVVSEHDALATTMANMIKERIGQAGAEVVDGQRWRASWKDSDRTDWKALALKLGANDTDIQQFTKETDRKIDIRKKKAAA